MLFYHQAGEGTRLCRSFYKRTEINLTFCIFADEVSAKKPDDIKFIFLHKNPCNWNSNDYNHVMCLKEKNPDQFEQFHGVISLWEINLFSVKLTVRRTAAIRKTTEALNALH